MTVPSRATTPPPPEVDPTRITRHCANGQHSRCRGRVTMFTPNGRQHYEPCACPAADCNHGPIPRKRK